MTPRTSLASFVALLFIDLFLFKNPAVESKCGALKILLEDESDGPKSPKEMWYLSSKVHAEVRVELG